MNQRKIHYMSDSNIFYNSCLNFKTVLIFFCYIRRQAGFDRRWCWFHWRDRFFYDFFLFFFFYIEFLPFHHKRSELHTVWFNIAIDNRHLCCIW